MVLTLYQSLLREIQHPFFTAPPHLTTDCSLHPHCHALLHLTDHRSIHSLHNKAHSRSTMDNANVVQRTKLISFCGINHHFVL